MTTSTDPNVQPGVREPPPPRRQPDRYRGVGWGVALIVIGALWLAALAGVAIPWEVVLPTATIALGVFVLLIGGRGSADGLIGLGILVAVVALAVSFMPVPPSLTAGDRLHQPTDVAALEPTHTLGAGSLVLDLRGLELPEGVTEVAAHVTFGELIVRVPPDVTVTGRATVAIGETTRFGHTRGGFAPSLSLSQAGTSDSRVLDLDVNVGFGRIEVTR